MVDFNPLTTRSEEEEEEDYKIYDVILLHIIIIGHYEGSAYSANTTSYDDFTTATTTDSRSIYNMVGGVTGTCYSTWKYRCPP